MIRNCDNCGLGYVAKRPSSRFCGARCRIAANRRKAPATIKAVQGDPHMLIGLSGPFDPKVVLETIAANPSQPAAARVTACRAYAALSAQQPTREEKTMSLLDRRTAELLSRRMH
jgi:hypothetical protein